MSFRPSWRFGFSLRLIGLRLKREREFRNFRTLWILASAGMTTKAVFEGHSMTQRSFTHCDTPRSRGEDLGGT